MKATTTIKIILFFTIFFSIGEWNETIAQNAFPCDGKLYYFGDSAGITYLSYIDNYATIPVNVHMCPIPTATQNSLGGNPIDHYLYYNSGTQLYRLDNQCNATPVCTLPSSPSEGCFDYEGHYWYVSGGLMEYDINTCSVLYGPGPALPSGSIDFAFNPADCSFYIVSSSQTFKIDTLGVTIDTIAGGWGSNLSLSTIGGVAFGYDGILYGMPNNSTSSTLYGVNVYTGARDSIFTFSPGTSPSGGNDMASFLCNPVNAIARALPDTGCPGMTVYFTDTSTGVNNIRIWHFGDPNSGANDTSTLKNPSHTYDTSGTFNVKLVVSTGLGGMCIPSGIDSTTITVFVYNLPQPNAGNDHTFCKGDSVVLNASGIGHFQWSPSNSLNCDTCMQPIASPTATTTYILTFSDSTTGCINTDTLKVTVNPHPTIPSISIIGNIPICPGDSVLLNASPVSGDSLFWYPSNSLNCSTCLQPYASPISTTTYYIIVSDSLTGCKSIDSNIVPVKPAPIISTSGNTAICIGDTTTISGLGLGTLVWNPANGLSCNNCHSPNAFPTVTTTYHFTVTDTSSLCSTSDSLLIIVNPLPIIAVNNLDSICFGDSVALNTMVIGNYAWTWTPNSGLNCPTCSNPLASPTSFTTYHVLVTDNVTGCFTNDSVKVKVNLLPIIKIHSDSTVCFGDSLTITASGGIQYYWNNLLVADSIINSPINDTIYTVVGSDGVCHNYDSARVRVLPNPIPFLADTTVCEGEVITLTAAGRADIVWYNSIGHLVSIHTGFTFTTPHNTATITYYIASDSAMCHSKLFPFTIYVEDCPVFVPNVFTPNADGKNDKFTIDARGLASLHVKIFNRWGMLIYEWFTNDGGWDGSMNNGSKASDGTYFFIADMVDFYGVLKTQAGPIELISGK